MDIPRNVFSVGSGRFSVTNVTENSLSILSFLSIKITFKGVWPFEIGIFEILAEVCDEDTLS